MPPKTRDSLESAGIALVLLVIVIICYGIFTSHQKDQCAESGGHPIEVHNGRGSWICSTDVP